ncbi:unnamed protein product [Closterium sp. NIES-53]
MHSRLLVSGLPRFLPPLPRLLAPPCLPCVDGRQCAAPHSSFPPTTAPLQILHMDVWGPARVTGQGGEHYFLLVVDDYTRYTTVFPLQSKADDLPVLQLHSDRGDEFSSRLLEDFCGAEVIVQTFTLPASPRQNRIAKRHIGLVMEVARTSVVHAAAPHFLWLFAVRYIAEQLNLWPHVSHSETSPTLRWTGEVGNASAFWVWGSLALVRDPLVGKLSPRTLRCFFLGFPTDAPPCLFYHPGSCRVLSSLDVTFDESVCFYHLHPHRISPVPLVPLSLVLDPPPVAPLPPQGPAPSGVSHVDPPPLVEPLEVSSDTSGLAEGGDPTATNTVAPRRSVRLAAPPGFPPRPSSPPLQPVAVDSGAAGGGDSGGAGSGGAECPTSIGGAGGAAIGGTAVGGVGGAGGTGVGGAGGTGAGDASAGGTSARRQESLLPERLRKWAVRWGSPGGGAGHAGTAGAGGPPGLVHGGSGGAITQLQPSVLTHLLNLPLAATEFPVAGTTPPLLLPSIAYATVTA